ncbi:hypothetical protein ACHQM5_006496 [Ranunculus cassubicifolius]
MVEERTEIPLTPDVIELKVGSFRRSSLTPHTNELKDSSLTRSSEGRTSTTSGGGKSLPHYLRASTGSCHDACKYGTHHAFGEKERRPIRKGKRGTLSEGQSPVQSLSLPTRTKKPIATLTSSPDSVTRSSDAPKIKKLENRTAQPKVVSPSQRIARKTKSIAKSSFSSDPGTRSSDIYEIGTLETEIVEKKVVSSAPKIVTGAKSSMLKANSVGEKSSLSPSNPQRDRGLRRASDVKAIKNHDITKIAGKKEPVPQKATLYPKPSFNKPISLKTRKYRVLKGASPPKNASKDVKAAQVRQVLKGASPPKNENKARNEQVRRVLKGTSPSKNERKIAIESQEYQVLKDASTPKIESQATKEIREYQVLTDVFPPENESRAQKDEPVLPIDEIVSEKTLYVIEPKPESRKLEKLEVLSSPSTSTSASLTSPPSLTLQEEEYTESEYDSEFDETETDCEYDDETENLNGHDNSKEGYKRRSRRASVKSGEENDPGHKLKFRRGRVVDIQSENNEPRRLRFRKARDLGDNQNAKVDVRRKNFKKKELIDSEVTGDPETGKVVLRRQDGNEKKDTQGLLNIVLEKTANKLVETRKSKVKALVGAFETVISLQEK